MDQRIRIQRRRLLVLTCIALLIFLFGLNSSAVEYLYSSGFYRCSSVVQRAASSLLPFAAGDIFYGLFIVFCLWSVFKALRVLLLKKMDKQAWQLLLLRFTKFCLLLYIVFKVLWGLNYSRPSIAGKLGISNQKYSTEQLILLGDFLIARVNHLAAQLPQQRSARENSIEQLAAKSKSSYDRLARVNPFFSYPIAAVKPVVFGWLVTKIGIEGYYCPPTGEANVNMMLPATALPFVTSHEISHQLGVAREDEANLVGYLVSINSPDLFFRYSGYYTILRSVLFEIRMKSPDDFVLLMKKINSRTIADFHQEQQFWSQYNGDMSAYMGTALDKFLKMNNQKKGTDSYQDIVLWVFNLHKKEILQPRNGKIN